MTQEEYIRNSTATLLHSEFNIEPQTTDVLFDKGILTERSCRNILIKNEYVQKAKPKCKNLLKNKLAERWCVSVELIEKIIAKK